MNSIKAIIEKGYDGLYSIYLPEIAGLYGTGKTEAEAKENLNDVIKMALEHVEETGEYEYYAPLLGNHSIEYAYDLSGFFKTFDIFDVTAFSKKIGINSSLMRRYKTGRTKASASQKSKILDGIHSVADELYAIKF